MLIIPAIDIKDGCVVRLVQGKFDNKTIYSKDPVKTARHWVRQGAELLHVIDLDGASTGSLVNLDIVKDIIKNINIPIQFGGGIRKIEMIKKLLDLGVFRIALGTKAAEDSSFLKKAYEQFKDKIIVSIDARDSRVLIEGWNRNSRVKDALQFARTLKDIGFKQMIYTDVSKDGTLKGPNIKGIKNLLKKSSLKVIASGGISSLDDVYRLKCLEKQGLIGIIVGKALYEGRFTLSQALKLA